MLGNFSELQKEIKKYASLKSFQSFIKADKNLFSRYYFNVYFIC